jgi:hypothetical protein
MEPNLYGAMLELRQAFESLLKFRQQGFYPLRCEGIDRKSQESPALCDFDLNVFPFRHGSSMGQAGAQTLCHRYWPSSAR